jgi:hypothetical protein
LRFQFLSAPETTEITEVFDETTLYPQFPSVMVNVTESQTRGETEEIVHFTCFDGARTVYEIFPILPRPSRIVTSATPALTPLTVHVVLLPVTDNTAELEELTEYLPFPSVIDKAELPQIDKDVAP